MAEKLPKKGLQGKKRKLSLQETKTGRTNESLVHKTVHKDKKRYSRLTFLLSCRPKTAVNKGIKTGEGHKQVNRCVDVSVVPTT